MKKKIILGVAIITLLCGCGRTIPTLQDGKEAVVKFSDGSMISIDDLYGELKGNATTVLMNMIDRKILENAYKDKIDESKESAKNYIASLKNYYTDEKGNYDENALLSAINQYYGFGSLEAFQESVELNYLSNLAIDDYAKSLVTDKEIEKYYKDEVKPDREVLHIQIVPEVTDTMTDSEKKEQEEIALNEAKSVIAKLKKGEKFEDLAKEYTDDEATKENGGNMGSINKGTYGSEDFDKEIYSLKVGEYSKTPVKTTKGYEIVYIKSESEKKSLEDSKEDITKTLADEKLSKDASLQITAMVELRKKNGVEIIDSEINANYKDYINRLTQAAKNSQNN